MSKELAKHTIADQMPGDTLQILAQKTNEVITQIPQINKLEQLLEIQAEDPELIALKGEMTANIDKTQNAFAQGNQEIHAKLDETPEDIRAMKDEDYNEKFSFVLKH